MGIHRCEECGEEMSTICIIPKKRDDGSFATMACKNCAIRLEMYCEKHDRVHLGFEDGSTACIMCIQEKKDEALRDKERLIANLKKGLPRDEVERLAEETNMLTGIICQEPDEITLLWIASLATRKKTPLETVIKEIIASRSIDSILPAPHPTFKPLKFR